MIHMTASHRRDDVWTVFCRCPWIAGPFPALQEARAAGDAHLDEIDNEDAR